MRRTALFLLVCLLSFQAFATTVYLRSGTPGSFATISGASNTTPITITTTAAHGFVVGDLIYIQQVYGNWNANGLRKVASTPLTTTFTITDIADVNIAGNGTYTSSGFAGKVTAHTLVAHPRLMFDGPTGPITSVMDGSVTTSIRANPAWVVFQGMKYMNDAHTGTADTNAAIKSAGYDWGPGAFLLAEGWFMDRTKTAYLDTAKWFINNVEKRLAGGTSTGTNWYPGFFTASSLGRGSDIDWASHQSVEYMYAYSLIRDQLTSGERQTFADKILNNATDFGESCVNPMTWQTGTFSTVAGSKAIVGSGTDFTTLSGIGFAYIPHTTNANYIQPIWGYLPTVSDATHATLPAAAATTNSNNIFFTARAWQAGDCGWRWYTRQHQYEPMYDARHLTVKMTSAATDSDTTFSVDALPPLKSAPYLIYVYSYNAGLGVNQTEYAQVTAQSTGSGCPGGTPCLTVSRGYGNTTPIPVPNNLNIVVADPSERFVSGATVNPGPELVPYDEPRENLTLAKVYGYMAAGLALADDDERARLMFEQVFNYWYDFTYPYDKRSWTGITQCAGNPGYNRRQIWNLMLARLFKNSLSPDVDITGGNWLKSTLSYYPALEVSGFPLAVFPFSDSIVDPTYAIRHLDGYQIALGLFPTDDLSKKYNWWFRTRRGYNILSTYNSIYSMEMTSFGILLPGPTETQIGQIDYTATDPPHFTFNTVDQNDSRTSPIGVWSSRTDWGETGTHVLALSIQRGNDHTGIYPGPGAYKIAKAGVFLAGDAGTAVTNPDKRSHSNYLQTGGVDTPSPQGGGPIDRSSGDANFAYIRVNNSAAYLGTLGVQRAYRHLLHVKGAADLLLVYDDMATTSATGKLQNFYFYSDNYETPTFSLTGCKATFTRPTSRLVTSYVLPASPTCTHPTLAGLTYSYEGNPYAIGRYKIHQLVVDAGSQSTVNVLAIHKAFSDTTSDLPATTVISTASTHDGVLVAGASPVIALFPKNGTTPYLSAGFTTAHSGTASIYVAGMVPGNYSVTINGGGATAYVGDSAGMLALSGAAGTYAITNTDTSVPLSIGTTTLPDGTLAVSYFSQLLGVGGVIPYAWAISAGALPTGLSLNTSTGVISGTPTVTGPFSLTAQLTDGASTVVTQALTMNVGAGVIPVGVTTTSPNPAVLSAGSVTITASTVGGATPFAWTMPINSAGCSPTSGTGNSFTTVCTQPGSLDILVTDNTAATADLPMTVVQGVVVSQVVANGLVSARNAVRLGSPIVPTVLHWSTLTASQWANMTASLWSNLLP
jgi:hypothetical protein